MPARMGLMLVYEVASPEVRTFVDEYPEEGDG